MRSLHAEVRVTEILYTDRLDLGEEHLPVHLASDRQVYVRLDELCNFIGLDPKGVADRIRHCVSTADLLVFMTTSGNGTKAQLEAAFLNLAALSFWLGMVASARMNHPDRHDQLARYTFDFLDTSWMFYRAAARDLERTGIMQTRLVAKSNRKRPAIRTSA